MKWPAALLAVLALASCIRVRPAQRRELAKPKMQLDRTSQHVYESREGSVGGHGATGGGCGCN